MSIPSSNLLNTALSIIAPVPFDYYQFTHRSVNAIGLYESVYAAPRQLYGSIQATARSVYQEYGLDFQKQYVTVFVSADLIDITRSTSGDQIEWNGRRYQLVSDMPWFPIDGWISVLAVEVAPA